MPPFQAPSNKSLKRKIDAQDVDGREAKRSHASEQYWMVQWRNFQYKKHKTWDGDGVLAVAGTKATLHDSDGKIILANSSVPNPGELSDGVSLSVGGKELEIDCAITREEFMAGTCFGFGGGGSTTSVLGSKDPNSSVKQFAVPKLGQPKRSSGIKPQDSKGIPLQPVDLLQGANATNLGSPKLQSRDSCWIANWRKTGKTNKPWEGDAFMTYKAATGKMTMISEEGRVIGHASYTSKSPPAPGTSLYVGSKQVELCSEVSPSDLPQTDDVNLPSPGDQASAPGNNPEAPVTEKAQAKSIPPSTFYGTAPKSKKAVGPLHDPNAEGAIVMKVPTADHIKKYNKKNLAVVPVVVDPFLARKLRPHQVEGVKFMYECVMGLRKHEGEGCILADEMGLGKTLQTICLIWTLLKQNPYASATPAVQKVLIVCPVSLVNNWLAEFHKWVGRDRAGVVTCTDKAPKNVARQFAYTKTQKVMIIGYERLRTVIDELSACIPPIGLVVCDEGHRLKSASNKTTTMFSALRTRRRVILSGTPIQNDLGEFHAMANFCNPGLLDEYSTFKQVYEVPILKSRAPESSPKEMEMGEKRSAQLSALAKNFVLRREAKILGNYLPPKHEYAIFVTPTPIQVSMFRKLLTPATLDDLSNSSTVESLALVRALIKVCSSPFLLKATAEKDTNGDKVESLRKMNTREAVSFIPEGARLDDLALSGKMILLAKMLKAIYQNTEEKCVLVSHYTSTLNILEAYCKKKGYSYYRLDGQTPGPKRQEYVNVFNKSSQKSGFIFLLSSKAGGVGINLIGASRLCLVDSDWNPSHDLQSMARCHRDGQKRPVYIYRFLTTGTIDEKIYQRQVTKIGLSNSLMGTGDSSSKSDTFTKKDLKDIFALHTDTSSSTHDLLGCPCDDTGIDAAHNTDDPSEGSDDDYGSDVTKGFIHASQVKPGKLNKADRAYRKKQKEALAALGEWKHINCLRQAACSEVKDEILRNLTYRPKGSKQAISKPQSLLEAVELDVIAGMDNVVGVKDVPGGTVSYLFERSSTSTTEEAEEAETEETRETEEE